jgi:hypothetical protein
MGATVIKVRVTFQGSEPAAVKVANYPQLYLPLGESLFYSHTVSDKFERMIEYALTNL